MIHMLQVYNTLDTFDTLDTISRVSNVFVILREKIYNINKTNKYINISLEIPSIHSILGGV